MNWCPSRPSSVAFSSNSPPDPFDSMSDQPTLLSAAEQLPVCTEMEPEAAPATQGHFAHIVFAFILCSSLLTV